MEKKVLGIVGSYRKNGIIDALVSETLAGAEASGAGTKKIYLADMRIEFCRNCRQCTLKPGESPGECVQSDDFDAIMDEWSKSCALVIGAPVNFFNINALTRRFMERLVCFSYWPWGQLAPAMRLKKASKRAVLITASAMPAFMGRVFTGAPRALRLIAKTMGARPAGTIYAGMAARKEHMVPSDRLIRKARETGRRLVAEQQ